MSSEETFKKSLHLKNCFNKLFYILESSILNQKNINYGLLFQTVNNLQKLKT